MRPAFWSTNISSFFYSNINIFLIDYACCKLCNNGQSSSRITPDAVTIQELHTEGKTLLELLLKIG